MTTTEADHAGINPDRTRKSIFGPIGQDAPAAFGIDGRWRSACGLPRRPIRREPAKDVETPGVSEECRIGFGPP